MENINWGMIGCGDVTEVKSGPAFNKVPNSKLVAVMRRDAAKAKDYAERHGVPKWYIDASALINDPEINAIYIATPPSSHLEYAIAALKAGKFVYVEKPMTTDLSSAIELNEFVIKSNGKL
ncbi:MAG: Gfo/Idh/MocA family oxidoreductase, partial [Ginsengibacter sp.]